MTFSDAVQIVHAPGSLTVYFPPRFWGAILSFVLAFVSALLVYKFRTLVNILVFGIAGAAFIFMGLDFITYHATINLDATKQTFSYEERTFYYRTVKSYPLEDMEQAIVMNGSSQNQLLAVLVGHNGPKKHFGDGFNGRDGNFEAAHALNAFAAQYAKPSATVIDGTSVDDASHTRPKFPKGALADQWRGAKPN